MIMLAEKCKENRLGAKLVSHVLSAFAGGGHYIKKAFVLILLFALSIFTIKAPAWATWTVGDYIVNTASSLTFTEVSQGTANSFKVTLPSGDKYYKATYTKPSTYTNISSVVSSPTSASDVQYKLYTGIYSEATWQYCGYIIAMNNNQLNSDIIMDVANNRFKVVGNNQHTSIYGGFYNFTDNGKPTTFGDVYSVFANNEFNTVKSICGVIDNLAYYTGGEPTFGDINGDFVNNTFQAKDTIYGVIFNNGGDRVVTIGDINSNFINNTFETTSGEIYGTLIYNFTYNSGVKAIIGDINGDFISNIINSATYVKGGLVYNYNTSSEIGTISSDVISNSITAQTSRIEGGIVLNVGTIDGITGDYVKNEVTATNSYVLGGLIYNIAATSTETPTGDITGNFISNTVSANSHIYGGLIYNSAISSGDAVISSIVGDFIDNNVSASTDNINGGLISNWAKDTYGGQTKINYVQGKFINNSVSSGRYVFGGLIDNESGSNGSEMTIADSIFSGNYVACGNDRGVSGAIILNSGDVAVINLIAKDSNFFIHGN